MNALPFDQITVRLAFFYFFVMFVFVYKIFNEIIVELKICVICFRIYFLSFLLALNLFKLYVEDKDNQIIEIFVCYY